MLGNDGDIEIEMERLRKWETLRNIRKRGVQAIRGNMRWRIASLDAASSKDLKKITRELEELRVVDDLVAFEEESTVDWTFTEIKISDANEMSILRLFRLDAFIACADNTLKRSIRKAEELVEEDRYFPRVEWVGLSKKCLVDQIIIHGAGGRLS